MKSFSEMVDKQRASNVKKSTDNKSLSQECEDFANWMHWRMEELMVVVLHFKENHPPVAPAKYLQLMDSLNDVIDECAKCGDYYHNKADEIYFR